MGEEFVKKAPDFKGDGVSVWKAKTKNNETFLKIKILGKLTVNAFKYTPKKQENQEEF